MNIKKKENFSSVECNTSTMFTEPFHVILRHDKPIGNPLTKQEADTVLKWLTSVNCEWNEELDDWEIY